MAIETAAPSLTAAMISGDNSKRRKCTDDLIVFSLLIQILIGDWGDRIITIHILSQNHGNTIVLKDGHQNLTWSGLIVVAAAGAEKSHFAGGHIGGFRDQIHFGPPGSRLF